jgi:hypothetical protein
MEMRVFGRTGMQPSVLGFGCGAVGGLMVRGDPLDQERSANLEIIFDPGCYLVLIRRVIPRRNTPDDRQLHRCAVAPVVAHQAQGQATQGRDLSTLAPLWALRARTPNRAWARRAVGEG